MDAALWFAHRPTQRFAAPDTTPRPQPGLRGVAIVASAFLAILVDQTSTAIITTGLPYLQAITAVSPDEASWIVSAFNATYYAFILLSPWTMARIGRKRLLVGALLGYSLASLLLTQIADFPVFVLVRLVQGAFLGCVFVPAAILLFTSVSMRALRYAPPAFVLVSLSGSTLGTVIGGYVADEFGGSSVFIPGAIATLLTAVLIGAAVNSEDRPQPGLRLDVAGLLLAIVVFGALQFLANDGDRRSWFDDATVVIAACVFGVAVLAFILYELYLTQAPLVDLRMFAAHRNLTVGGIINVVIGSVGYSVTIFVAYLQALLGATPTVAGALVLVRLLTYAVGVPAAFFLITSRALDIRAVVVAGVLGSSLSLALFAHAMTPTSDLNAFIGLSLLFGLCFGMLNQPMGALVIGSMPLSLLAAGISIYKLTSPIGSMIATGAMQALFDRRSAAFQSRIAGDLSLDRLAVGRYVALHHGSHAGLAAIVTSQVESLAYASVMLTFSAIILVVVPIVFLAKIAKPAAPPANV